VAEPPAWERIAHVIAQGDGETATTPAADIRGANLVVLVLARGNPTTTSDSEGNEYEEVPTPIGGTPHVRFLYCFNPVTSAAFSASTTGSFSSATIEMLAYKTSVNGPLDAFSAGAASGAAAIHPGDVTPTQTFDLIIAACAINGFGRMPFEIDDDAFDIVDSVDMVGPPYAYGLAVAELFESDIAVKNPGWSVADVGAIYAASVAFKSARGSPPPGTHYEVTVDNPIPAAGATVTATAQLKRPDESNDPSPGITVNWSKSGGGTLDGATSVTDASGRASISMLTSGTPGDDETITATDSASRTGTTPTITTQAVPTGGPNEPVDFVMHSYFDATHPLGFNQPGWQPIGNRPGGEIILDAPTLRGGKGAVLRIPPHFRTPITSIAPGTGPYAGKTILVAPNVGLDYFDSSFGKNPHYDPANLAQSNPVGVHGVVPYAFGATARLGVIGSALDVTALDDDTLLINHDLAADPQWTGGSGWAGDGVAYVGVYAGAGWSVFNTLYNWNAMYNTGHYLRVTVQVGEDDGSQYPGNTGTGGTKLGFGKATTGFNRDALGAKAYPAPQGDPADEASPVMAICISAADSYQGYDIPTGPQNISIGKGVDPLTGHFYPVLAERGDSELVRGTPKDIEILTLSDSGGGAKDGDVKMWFDQTVAGNPASVHCNNVRFGFEVPGICLRAFHVPSWDDVEGGGGTYATTWKIVKLQDIYQSVGYPVPGTRPHHWELTADNLTPNVGDDVLVTAVLVDENGNRIMSCVNNTPYGMGGPYGSGDIDCQTDANNGATWYVRGANLDPLYPSNALEGWGRLEDMGQIQYVVHITNPGTTRFKVRDIGRALNYTRYGAWREGTIDLEAA
jgi:hypothetical protein